MKTTMLNNVDADGDELLNVREEQLIALIVSISSKFDTYFRAITAKVSQT